MFRPLLDHLRLTTQALSRVQLVLATITIVTGLAFWTWSDFEDAHLDAEAKVSIASLAMDELAHRSLLAIDVVLEAVAARVSEQGVDKFGSGLQQEYLRQVAWRLPETGALFIADKTGNVIAATVSYLPVNVSDRAWFRALQGGVSLYVGRALEGRTVHTRFFPVARSIRGPGDALLGAVQAGVEVTYIASLFRSLNVGPGAHLGLYEIQEGAVVARYPMSAALLGETVGGLPYFSLLATSQTQSWAGWVRSGGVDQLVSARRLNGWPLIVSASLEKAEIYSNAWSRLLWRSVIAAVVFAAFLGLTSFAIHQAKSEASLTGELEHRVRNMLSLVMTLVDRARENTQSSEQFALSVRGRVQSMANTQTLLGQSRWRGVSLVNLIRTELDPYATGTNTNLDGPAVFLTPNATHAVAVVIHELATNAAKYGALSLKGGHVSVRWIVTDKHRPATLRIQWVEAGGPEVTVPTRQGYGSSVIRELLSSELDGSVDLVFAHDGVRCTISLPTSRNVERLG